MFGFARTKYTSLSWNRKVPRAFLRSESSKLIESLKVLINRSKIFVSSSAFHPFQFKLVLNSLSHQVASFHR